MTEDIPIHSYALDKVLFRAKITRKIDMYGTEDVCEIWIDSPKHDTEGAHKKLSELANALCDYLETKRPNK